MATRQTAAIVIGAFEYEGVKQGQAISDSTMRMLEDITEKADIDADLIYVTEDPNDAGKNKSRLGMKYIRQQRPRVLSEIMAGKPDFVICFGPVATACVFDKGNLVEGELLRAKHHPLGEGMPPVFVTFGLSNVRWRAGMAQWLYLDVAAAAMGGMTTTWPKYELVLPGDPWWDEMPEILGAIDVAAPHEGEPKVVSFDFETYPGLDPWHPDARIRMVVLTVGAQTWPTTDKHTWVVQAKPDGTLPFWVWEIAGSDEWIKMGSNIKYDAKWAARFGHKIVNMDDTAMREHIKNESNPKKDLKSLTFIYEPELGDYSKPQRDLVRERGGWEHVGDDEQYDYCAGDGVAGWGAYWGQESDMKRLAQPHRLFKDLYQVLAKIEQRGACIDMDANRRLDKLYIEKLTVLRQVVVKVLGPINIDSPKQLAEALKAAIPDINLSIKEWKQGTAEDEEESTAKSVLKREASKHPVLASVLEYKKYRHRHSTFIKGIYEKHAVKHPDGQWYVHPSYNVHVVQTFRLSSSKPNGQNIPRKDNDDPVLTIKKQYKSRFKGGKILEVDQSQVEIRYSAWKSQDENLIAAIVSGRDIHKEMASIMLEKPFKSITYEERESCKTQTFLILYGGGAKLLAQELGISRRKAQQFIADYFDTFPGLKRYIDLCHDDVRRTCMVRTDFGFERHFVEPDQWDSPAGFSIQRQAFNTPIQNGAACITYACMIALEYRMRAEGMQSIIFGQVHDSILIDVHPDEEGFVIALAQTTMDHGHVFAGNYGVDFTVPLAADVEIGTNWGDMSPVPKES